MSALIFISGLSGWLVLMTMSPEMVLSMGGTEAEIRINAPLLGCGKYFVFLKIGKQSLSREFVVY
jgi:hypothetical protein